MINASQRLLPGNKVRSRGLANANARSLPPKLTISVAVGSWSATADEAAPSAPAPPEADYRLIESIADPEAIAQVNDLRRTETHAVVAWLSQYQPHVTR